MLRADSTNSRSRSESVWPADDPRYIGPAEESDDEDQQRDPQLVALQTERLVREDAGQGHREDQQREGQKHIHQPAGEGVHPAAEETGDDAERGPDSHRQQGGQKGNQQGYPAAVHDPAEDVATVHRLNAHEVIPAHSPEAADWGQGAARCVNQLLVELVRRMAEVFHDQRREYRYQDEKDQEGATGKGDLVPFEPHPGDLPEGAALRRPGANQYSLRCSGLSASADLRR